ncbi:hypothetical protein E2C01_040606 [Portunus trituberculatus]|uniref:Uncharacterized protein n=1 Tax=Portunus trituberculatus TaxID=210409 RepID=A0A5B7FMX9_PORTR|nr:hypothetical protein [Portunus trituberculatus]
MSHSLVEESPTMAHLNPLIHYPRHALTLLSTHKIQEKCPVTIVRSESYKITMKGRNVSIDVERLKVCLDERIVKEEYSPSNTNILVRALKME